MCTLAGQLAAATCRFLRLLADFDARRGWATDGLRSCAHWLSWRCGIDLRTAREQVRVARSLNEPKVAAAFAGGRVSYSKGRAIARVATTHTEDDLLQAALHAPAAQVERLTRGLRRASQAADDNGDSSGAGGPSTRRRCRVSWRWDDDGRLVIWGRLDAEDGARLLAGLTRAEALTVGTDDTGPRGGSAEPPPPRPDLAGRPPHDIGPALVAMADLARDVLDAPVFAPAAQVWVHTDADTLTCDTDQPDPHSTDDRTGGAASDHDDPDGQAGAAGRIDDGPPLSEAAIRRLACDGDIRLVVDSRLGGTLDLGRRRRPPTASSSRCGTATAAASCPAAAPPASCTSTTSTPGRWADPPP